MMEWWCVCVCVCEGGTESIKYLTATNSNKKKKWSVKHRITNKLVGLNHTTNFVYIGSLNTDINHLKDKVQTALFKDPVHTAQ
jgi:hypothetical protein